MRNICLFSDDFRKFPIGEFPYDPDHSAAGEYHYVTPKGVCGEWKDQAWTVMDCYGRKRKALYGTESY